MNVVRLLDEHPLTSPGLTGEWEAGSGKIETGEEKREGSCTTSRSSRAGPSASSTRSSRRSGSRGPTSARAPSAATTSSRHQGNETRYRQGDVLLDGFLGPARSCPKLLAAATPQLPVSLFFSGPGHLTTLKAGTTTRRAGFDADSVVNARRKLVRRAVEILRTVNTARSHRSSAGSL